MKILFLDIDGVVNNHRTPQTDGWPIDPYCALLVGKIQLETGCKIVLSSSWRCSTDGIDIVKKKVAPIFDVTPISDGLVSRGVEIQAWLEKHPDVEKYAILDDNRDMLDDQFPNFFQTYFFCCGLTEDIANKVIKHLS